jgi:hypothetical protein
MLRCSPPELNQRWKPIWRRAGECADQSVEGARKIKILNVVNDASQTGGRRIHMRFARAAGGQIRNRVGNFSAFRSA